MIIYIFHILHTYELLYVIYLTHLCGLVLFPLSSILKYLIYNLLTLNIGISKFIATGPISFLAVCAVYVANNVNLIY